MSRTFYTGSKFGRNPELIERRKLRYREYRQENGISKEHISISYVQELTKKALARIIQDSKNGQKFIGKIHDWDDQYILSYYDGTFLEKYAGLIEEKSSHPIYSSYTEGKITALLEYNPECTDIYLSKDESPYPLLTHQSIIPKEKLSEKKVYQLKIQLWGLIVSLIPPGEFIETAEYVRKYCEHIIQDIENTKMHINVALAKPFDENLD